MTHTEYKTAVEQLKKYSYHYYVLDDPITTDEEYDILYHQVVAYELSHPTDIIPDSPTHHEAIIQSAKKIAQSAKEEYDLLEGSIDEGEA